MVFYLSTLRKALKTERKLRDTEGNLDGLTEKDLKNCLTNRTVRGKINEFEPRGENEFEKDWNRGFGAKKL